MEHLYVKFGVPSYIAFETSSGRTNSGENPTFVDVGNNAFLDFFDSFLHDSVLKS